METPPPAEQPEPAFQHVPPSIRRQASAADTQAPAAPSSARRRHGVEAARHRARNAKVAVVTVTAGLLAVVGLAARISHPGGSGSAADPTQNLTQFTLDDDALESDSGSEGVGQGDVFLAPSVGPPVASTGTS